MSAIRPVGRIDFIVVALPLSSLCSRGMILNGL